ncbi:zinc finger BED domain-containing protein RICESLEEPER 2-like [Rhizophagus clarus]|uniref:Zinc finger BED domain-containing protein RICESLEEPER 2-like n=1 Tax=Rhizophagus clarus TaxID=94130 RepID=A0A8H3R1P3_9GLOM|nr:zinc finger BED domain-containing protein RICESLEEPER 2-like [Rhizophagus clarus]
MSDYKFYYDEYQESEYNEEENETTDNERNVQEFSQEPFQESPREESPQEPFQESPQEPFQEPPQEHSQEEDNLKKAKTYSDTWQYFNTRDPQHPTKVVCKKCNHTYSKSTGISTLKEHLKKVHAVGRSIAEKLDDDVMNSTFGHYHCTAHILNLAAQQGLELIDNAVVKVRQLIIKIKNSVIISDELRKLCKCAKINYLKPELDIRTRWNSTFNMLKKMEKMWNGVRMLAVCNQEVQMLMPTEADWKIIRETMIILEPLERATVYLSAAQYPTIADIRFVFLVSTVLDPWYKLSLFEVGASAAEAVSAVTSLLANYHHVTIPENRDVDETSSVSSVSNVSDELDRYLALQVDENVKPLLW